MRSETANKGEQERKVPKIIDIKSSTGSLRSCQEPDLLVESLSFIKVM